jgi:GntR family transcriptional regulator, galactonate operon transcriptional repressor
LAVFQQPRSRPVERGLHGLTTAALARRILAGDLQPGDTVDPEQLGEDFGVSRTVVREALRALGAKGMIDARPNRGTFVRSRRSWNLLDPDLLRWQAEGEHIADLFRSLGEVRAIVEPAAARLAALRRTEAQLATIKEALSGMESDNEPDLFTQADLAFHAAVLHATGNELLEQMESVIAAALSVRDRFVHSRRGWHDAIPVHAELAEAIERQDPDAAIIASQNLLALSSTDLRAVGIEA